MENGYRIKLGFLPTRRHVFDPVVAGEYKRAILAEIRKYPVEIVTIDELNAEGLIFDAADAKRAAEFFLREKVDAVFAPHCNFGTEDAVAKVGAIVGKPFLLWGPRDEAAGPGGFRQRDSQCGLFATSKCLQRYGVPFSYITNSDVTSATFACGFDNFIRTAAVVKALHGVRIGQIDTRPEKFLSVMVNESELLEKFGMEICPVSMTFIEKWTKDILHENGPEYRATLDLIRSQYTDRCVNAGSIETAAALKVAIARWAQEKELSAVAIQCWEAMQTALGIFPCFVNALLTDEGLPVACETDVLGAVSVLMLRAAALGREQAFLADLTTRHPGNPNAELLWHCGNFPPSVSTGENVIGPQCENPYDIAGRWKAKDGNLTIARLDGMAGCYRLLMGHARTTDGPANAGTYLWAEFGSWPLWERRIIYGPYIHHVAVTYGHYAPALYDACRYISGLEPDAVEPDMADLEAMLLYE